jgi:hypothetical protein
MAGYWNNPVATAATVTPDAWLKSGDAGYLGEDGYIYLFDRVKDMIVSGGENIYPAEVENVLMAHEDVGDVAVIGIPDATWGEAVKAVVVAAAGALPQRVGPDRVRSRAAGRLQAAQIHRLHHGTATQPQRQTPQTTAARAVLGGRRASHPLIRTVSRRRAADVIDTDSWRSWPAGCSSGRRLRASLRFYRDQLGLAIARDYGAGTVFYAGQSLIELAGHGTPSAGGTMWLQVRDVYAAEEELRAAASRSPRGKQEPWGCTRCTSSIPTACC